jgi:hypothetical protein
MQTRTATHDTQAVSAFRDGHHEIHKVGCAAASRGADYVSSPRDLATVIAANDDDVASGAEEPKYHSCIKAAVAAIRRAA